MPSFPPLESPLSDGLVTLRLSAERDIPEVLIAYQDDPELHLALGEQRPPSGAALGRRAERAAENRRSGEAITFTILEAGSDTCRGEVRITDVDWIGGRAALKLWVSPRRRDLGLGRRAHALVRAWLRAQCGLQSDCSPAPGEEGAGQA